MFEATGLYYHLWGILWNCGKFQDALTLILPPFQEGTLFAVNPLCYITAYHQHHNAGFTITMTRSKIPLSCFLAVSSQTFTSMPIAKCNWIKTVPHHNIVQQSCPSKTFCGRRSLFKKFLPDFSGESNRNCRVTHEDEQNQVFLGFYCTEWLFLQSGFFEMAEVPRAPVFFNVLKVNTFIVLRKVQSWEGSGAGAQLCFFL